MKLTVLLVLATGCALLAARTPLEGWFVSRTLWTDAKGVAVACMESGPCRELERARAVVVTIDQGDALVTRTDGWLQVAQADGLSDVENMSLQMASAELEIYEGQLRKAVLP